MHDAVNARSLEVVQLLLRHDCAKNAKSAIPNLAPDQHGVGGETPLHVAVRNKLHEFVSELVAAGCDVDEKNCEGFTPQSLGHHIGWTDVDVAISEGRQRIQRA